jgi:hypothetical protein
MCVCNFGWQISIKIQCLQTLYPPIHTTADSLAIRKQLPVSVNRDVSNVAPLKMYVHHLWIGV